MKLYELIIAIHPSLSTEESNQLITSIESLFPGGIKEKDDIWYQTVYNIHGLKYWSQAYFIDYSIELDPALFPEIKQTMSLMKWLLRSLFLKKSHKDEPIVFKKINELYSDRLLELASKDKKAKKTRDQKQQLLDTAKELQLDIEVVEKDDHAPDSNSEE